MTADARWSVAILEDDQDTLEFFSDSIQACSALRRAAAFGSVADALEWFSSNRADILLADLGLPDGNGLDVVRTVCRRWPDCDVLVISVFGDEDNVVASIEAGAVGYLQKDAIPQDIAATLLGIKNGASPISPMIARKLLGRFRSGSPTAAASTAGASPGVVSPGAVSPGVASPGGVSPGVASPDDSPDNPPALSPSERQVLELIARGYTYAEIARLRAVTTHTIQSHIKNLYGKLAVHSRSEAVFEASRLGLLDAPLRSEPR